MAGRFADARDMDTDELASLLRNIAHGMEEGDLPITAVETQTSLDAEETFTCEITIEYTPNETILIPANRLTGDE